MRLGSERGQVCTTAPIHAALVVAVYRHDLEPEFTLVLPGSDTPLSVSDQLAAAAVVAAGPDPWWIFGRRCATGLVRGDRHRVLVERRGGAG